MDSGNLNDTALRKRALVQRSQDLRRNCDRELELVRVWIDKAEPGFKLATQGRDLFMVLTPVLASMVEGKGSMLKTALSLVSNWPVLKSVWQGFRALRDTAR